MIGASVEDGLGIGVFQCFEPNGKENRREEPGVRLGLVFLAGGMLMAPPVAHAQRQMEKLGRGVVAVRTSSTRCTSDGGCWGPTRTNIAFNLYRSTRRWGAGSVDNQPNADDGFC